jgi:hypothetical protein
VKFTLTLNSHSLSYFQQCEAQYQYSTIFSVEKLGSKIKMDQGILYAQYLEAYYRNKIRPKRYTSRYLGNAPAWINRITKRLGYSNSDSRKLFGAMLDYTIHYQAESWIPLAIERGFSRIIYEDSDNRFIYEGRPDFVGLDATDGDLIVSDHKTQGRSDSFYPHNNQALGYLWNYEAKNFIYNYIVLNKTTEFRREIFTIQRNQIDAWVSDTTEWYFRVKAAMERKSFLKSLNCQGRWSICPFTLVCERPTLEQKLYTIQAQYTKRKPYRSW